VTRTEAPVRTDTFRPVLGATVVLVLALLSIAALKSYRDLASARAREHTLQTQIEQTRARSEKLKVRIDRLRHDPGMLERLAREDLGMVRPNDVVIELPDGSKPAVPAPPPQAPVSPVPAVVPVSAPAVSPGAGLAGPPAPPPAAAPAASGPPGRG
jgi:cell division protein FtsB